MSKSRLYATLAALSMFGGFSGFGGNTKSDHPQTHTDKLLEEVHSIKGLSAKEMGTSGKKKLSRAQRKKQNKRKN